MKNILIVLAIVITVGGAIYFIGLEPAPVDVIDPASTRAQAQAGIADNPASDQPLRRGGLTFLSSSLISRYGAVSISSILKLSIAGILVIS